MKRLWFSAIFLSLIIVLCIFEQAAVKKGYREISQKIDYAIAAEELSEKRDYCLEIEKDWDKYYFVISLMADHSMIENSNASVGMLDTISTLSFEETNEILVEAKSEIDQLYKNTVISINNIV